MAKKNSARQRTGRPKAQQRRREIAGAPEQEPGAEYTPPPRSACGLGTFFVPLESNEDRVAVHQRTYKTRIVHFSIEHQHFWDGDWVTVARIDSSNGSIHLHLWDRWGNVLVDHEVLVGLPPSPEGQSVVHTWYDRAFAMVDDKADEHLRRWSE